MNGSSDTNRTSTKGVFDDGEPKERASSVSQTKKKRKKRKRKKRSVALQPSASPTAGITRNHNAIMDAKHIRGIKRKKRPNYGDEDEPTTKRKTFLSTVNRKLLSEFEATVVGHPVETDQDEVNRDLGDRGDNEHGNDNGDNPNPEDSDDNSDNPEDSDDSDDIHGDTLDDRTDEDYVEAEETEAASAVSNRRMRSLESKHSRPVDVHRNVRDTSRKPKTERLTAEERNGHIERAQQNMKKHTHLPDAVFIGVSTTSLVGKGTIWSTRHTMYFALCQMQNIHPVSTVSMNMAGSIIKVDDVWIELNGYKPKAVPKFPESLDVLFRTSHAEIVATYDFERKEMSRKYSHVPRVKDVPTDVPDVMDTIVTNDCVAYEDFAKYSLRFVRLRIQKLVQSHPESGERNVQNDVLAWMVKHLKECDTIKEYDAIVDSKAARDMYSKALKLGCRVVPEHLMWVHKERRKSGKPTIEVPLQSGAANAPLELKKQDVNDKEAADDIGEDDNGEDTTGEQKNKAKAKGKAKETKGVQKNKAKAKGKAKETKYHGVNVMAPTSTGANQRRDHEVKAMRPGAKQRKDHEVKAVHPASTTTTVITSVTVQTTAPSQGQAKKKPTPKQRSTPKKKSTPKVPAAEDANARRLRRWNEFNKMKKKDAKHARSRIESSITPTMVGRRDEDFTVLDDVFMLAAEGNHDLYNMLKIFETKCRSDGHYRLLHAAVKGICSDSLKECLQKIQGNVSPDFHPPVSAPPTGINFEFQPPGEGFIIMGRELLFSILFVFLNACDNYGVAPPRWNWDFALLKECELLDSFDLQKVLLAKMYVSNLASATGDTNCIQGVGNLFRAGFDSIDATADGDIEEIRKCIAICGITKRAEQIQAMARAVRDEHKGVFPTTLEKLTSFSGYGTKGATLFLTEAIGLFSGIASDSHVTECSKAFDFIRKRKGMPQSITPHQAEAALRQWVPWHRLKDVNRILGSMAQIFCTELRTVRTTEQKKHATTVMNAMTENLHLELHVGLLWCCIKLMRKHYFSLNISVDGKRNPTTKRNQKK